MPDPFLDALDAVQRPAPTNEPAFRQWYANAARQYDLNPNPDSPDQFYDYRAAFRAGARPDASGHWPSQYKRAGHPNEVVGGFNTRTGARVPGAPRAKDAAELERLGWDAQTARTLAATPEADPVLAALDAVQAPKDTRSLLSKAYDAVFTAPEALTRAAAAGAERLEGPWTLAEAEAVERQPKLFGIPLGGGRPARAYWGGAAQGAASLVTPGDVALTVSGLEELKPVLQGLRGGVRTARAIQRGADVASVARGTERLANAESLPEAAAGVAQIAGGGAGVYAGRTPAPEARPGIVGPGRQLRAGATYTASPSGQVAPAGVDIPMTQTPDGSYVRSVPAEYARRDVRGLLPEGRTPIITPPPAAPPDPSGGRTVPAAVLDRNIDPYVPAKEGVTVRQYASDPAAVDAPIVGDEQRAWLERMRADLQEFQPQQGRMVRGDRTGSGLDPDRYVHGEAGSPVGDDVRVISGQKVSNRQIAAAVDDLLAGKPPTNKLHTAALDAAQGYIEKREGYRGPILPEGEATMRGGTAPVDEDEFAAFTSAFDEVEPGTRGGREPGEEGFVAPGIAPRVAGGAAGAAYGAATGEDTEDRLKRAAIFGAAGVVAPSLLGRGGPRRAPGIVAGLRPAAAPGLVEPAAPRGRGPVSPSGRTGRPILDPMAGTEPFLKKFSNPLVREGISARLEANGGYAAQRRGQIDTATLSRFADEVKINVTQPLGKGSTLNAEQITAYGRGLAETQFKINDLAAKVASANASDLDKVALLAAKADADVLQKSLMGARAEAGRALAAFNFYNAIHESGNVNLIRDVLKAPGARKEAERLAAGVLAQGADPLAQYRWLQQQRTSTAMQKVRSYYYSNILSGLKTHERNLLGNVSNLFSEAAAKPIAAGIDVARSAVTGAPRTVRLDEFPASMVGAAAGVERGFRDAAFTMRHGVSPDRLRTSTTAAAAGEKFDVPRVEWGGGAANPVNWPGRALDAGDTFFRSIADNMETYGLAHTQAKNEGLSGKAFTDRMADLRAGLSPEGQTIKQQAATYASRAVFQEKPGAFTTWVSQSQQFPAMSLVVPFVKTPGNIARQGAEFSPMGFLMKQAWEEGGRTKALRGDFSGLRGGREGAQAQARATAGTLATGLLFWLATSGRLSGNGPRDPDERANLEATGWKPNSIKLGDKWVSHQLMQPLSLQASVVGNAVEDWKARGSDPKNADRYINTAFQTVLKTGGSFLDQSFLSGVSDLIEAMDDPERFGTRWVGRMASGFVPFTGAARTVQQAIDPIARQPKTIGETVAAGIPGLSTSVPARIDPFGQPTVREGGPLRLAGDPLSVSSAVNDPVLSELQRLKVTVALPSATLRLPPGQVLTRDQEQRIKAQRGQAVQRELRRLIRGPRYQGLNDAAKREALTRAIARARRGATTRLRREFD